MAGTSLLALIDDIAAVLDDIAVMSKIAARKTAGVLGDDLALNAQQVAGVRAEREIPVVWAVAKGSLRNKLILVPAALLISAIAPWAITPLLMLGGLYLCYEGVEKVFHAFAPGDEKAAAAEALHAALLDGSTDMVEWEKNKIKGAIRTDFILSAEIIVISLGTVANANMSTRVGVVCAIALLMTVGVYGLVAAIVKLDDAGLHLLSKNGEGLWPALQRKIGGGLLSFAPFLMKSLGFIGTIAMFMVGGGILVHGFHYVEVRIADLAALAEPITVVGPMLAALAPSLLGALFGVIAGALALGVVTLVQHLWGTRASH